MQTQDGVAMYTQMLGLATAGQLLPLKKMRHNRDSAPRTSSYIMTAEEKQALRNAPTRDELIAKLAVPDRRAFLRFREERACSGNPWRNREVGREGDMVVGGIALSGGTTDDSNPVEPASAGRDDKEQQYLRLHTTHPISAYHILSRNVYTHTVNPNIGWHIEQMPCADMRRPTAPNTDLDTRWREEMRRKTERDQMEIQNVKQSIRWFEYQLQLSQDGTDHGASENTLAELSSTASKPWGAEDPEREQTLRRGLAIMVQRLPKHLVEKRAAAQGTAAATPIMLRDQTGNRRLSPSESDSATCEHDEDDTRPQPYVQLASLKSARAKVEAHKNDMQTISAKVDQSSMQPWAEATGARDGIHRHWREERFAAIDRRLCSTRAAKRLDVETMRRQANEQLQLRSKQIDADISLVEDWEYRHRRRIAWSRMDARWRRFEAIIYKPHPKW